MRRNEVRQKLADGGVAVNGWCTLDSEHVAESLSYSGFDSITIDAQHGLFGMTAAIALIRAVSVGPAIPMARCSALNPAEIGKLLDAGCYGIICPNIESAEQAEALVAACRYPGAGARSFAAGRTMLYGGADYAQHANEEILVWAMIESAAALENLPEILATGIDGVYFGPNDLRLSLGMPPGGRIPDSLLPQLLQSARLAHSHGKFTGIFAADAEEGSMLAAEGIGLITPGNDIAALTRAVSASVARVRETERLVPAAAIQTR